MKFSAVILASVALSQAIDIHPLKRLDNLTRLSDELINDSFTFLKSKDGWISKFSRNAARMEKSYHLCGTYDQNQLADEEFVYSSLDANVRVEEITAAFAKWTTRHIATCPGQRNHNYQVKRMTKWNDLLQKHLAGQD